MKFSNIADDSGTVIINCNLEPGSYIITLSEYKKLQNDNEIYISSSIHHMCFSPPSVNVVRTCYNILPEFLGYTVGGVIANVCKESLTLTNCYPEATIVTFILNPYQLQTNNQNLINENKQLKHTMELLEDRINQIYYAPGMPGYLDAELEFNELNC
jgi:hypothetical protein